MYRNVPSALLRVTIVALGFGIVLMVGGCQSHRLEVVTDPPGSHVTIKSAKARPVRSGAAPLRANLPYNGVNNHFLVEVRPSKNLSERYLPMSRELTKEQYDALPTGKQSSIRRLTVALDEKDFVTIPYVEVVLDARRHWRGVVTRSRAYKDVRETGGAVPALIVEFGENLGIQAMALSPDGDRVVYSVATYNKTAKELKKIFADAEPRHLDIVGANLRGVSLTRGGIEHITSESFRDMFPSFTPDGESLLFSSNRRRPNSEDLLKISATKRIGIRDVYIDNRDARVLRPTQAQNGTIAFALETPRPVDPDNRFSIWTLGGPNSFPTSIQTGRQPSISPDGQRIAYIGHDRNLWVVYTDGAQATQVTSGASTILERYKESLTQAELKRYEGIIKELGVPDKMPYSYPSWSSDGQSIVYTSMEGSDSTGRPNEDVWIMRFDGAGKRQLTTNGSIDRYPLLSPNLEWVYFMSNRGGQWAIWRIPI